MVLVEEWWSFAQKGESAWVTHILSTEVCISTQVAKGQDGVEIKSMINLVLVKRDILRYVQEVMAVRGMGRSLSDHHVLCKVRLVGAWIKMREMVVEARRIGRKMNEDVNGNRKLFLKEVSNAKGRKL